MGKKDQKVNAAKKALEYVKKGMTVGLGSGSTAEEFIRLLGEKNKKSRLGVKCVSTSEQSAALAEKVGLKLVSVEKAKKIDLAVDGADEVDGKKRLIKGNTLYAFLKEKEVDYRAEKFVVVVDEGKIVERLSKPVLIEVEQDKRDFVFNEFADLDCEKKFVKDDAGERKVSESENLIAYLDFPDGVPAPEELEKRLDATPGVKANGIFSRDCTVIVGKDRETEVLD